MIIVSTVIFLSFVVHIICYIWVSRIDKSYLNVLFPSMINSIPINFVFEYFYIYSYGLAGSIYAYMYLYLCFTCTIVFTTCGYVFVKKSTILKLPFSKPNSLNPTLSLLFILIGVIIFLPVLIEFSDFIFSPREIYTRTRTGYGMYFFLSTFFSLLGFIVFLFSRHNSIIKIIGLAIFVTVFLFLHGSKGQVILVFLSILLYFIYVRGWSVSVKLVAMLMAIISTAVVGLFMLTVSYEYDNIFKLIANYSDYNRNAMMVIDDPSKTELYKGQLTLESTIYSRIPRAIMPNKPKNYGTFRLAEKYYPKWFDSDTGSPAFGLGTQYADFGIFTIVYVSFWALITGVLLKLFVNRVRLYRTPGDFVVLLFLCGITLLPLGDGYLLPEHFVTAMFLNMLLSIKLK